MTNQQPGGAPRPAPGEQHTLASGVSGGGLPPRAQAQGPPAAGPPAEPAAPWPPPGGIKRGKLIFAVAIAVVVAVTAIIGHAVARSSSIAVGDCVVTNPNALTQWDIKKVDCNNPGSGLDQFTVEKVVQVQSGSNGDCTGVPGSDTTFQDDPAGKTYCLTPYGLGQP